MAELVELHDQAQRFLRDPSQRLLHVVTTAPLRGPVLDTLASLESNPLAPGPFIRLEPPHGTADPGWNERADLLRRNHAARCEAASPDDGWPLLPPRGTAQGLAGFAEQLAQVIASTPGQAPWVVILAPAHVKAPPQWARGIAMLLQGTGLDQVRWMIVDVEQSSLADAVADETVRRRVDCKPGEGANTFDELAAAVENPDLGAPGARLPNIEPPPRPGQLPPTPPTPEQLQHKELAGLIVQAGQHQQQANEAKAVEAQRRARDLCEKAGWSDTAVSMELLLGGYLLSARSDEQAELSHRRAVEQASATNKESPQLLPISQLSLGSTMMARGDRPAAMLAYSEAATSALNSGSAPLSIEACRLTGDVALLLGMEAQAIAFWSKAVNVALSRPAEAGSGGHCARALAMLCKQRRLTDASERYWQAARDLDGIDLPALEHAQADYEKQRSAHVDAHVEAAEQQMKQQRAATKQAKAEAAAAKQAATEGAAPAEGAADGDVPAADALAKPSAPTPDAPEEPSAVPTPRQSAMSAEFEAARSDDSASQPLDESDAIAAPLDVPLPAIETRAPPTAVDTRHSQPDAPAKASTPTLPPPLSPTPLPPETGGSNTVFLPGPDVSTEAPSSSAPDAQASTPTPTGAGRTVFLPAPSSSDSAPIDEGTINVSVDELAALHWQGARPAMAEGGPLPPPQVVHEWSDQEQDAIRRATAAALNEETTGLLTPEEVIALQGKAALPPACEPSPEATAMVERASAIAMLQVTDPEAEGTAWIDADKLEAVRARFGHRQSASPPAPAPVQKKAAKAEPPVKKLGPMRIETSVPRAPRDEGDQTTVVTPERLAELARIAAEKKKNRDKS